MAVATLCCRIRGTRSYSVESSFHLLLPSCLPLCLNPRKSTCQASPPPHPMPVSQTSFLETQVLLYVEKHSTLSVKNIILSLRYHLPANACSVESNKLTQRPIGKKIHCYRSRITKMVPSFYFHMECKAFSRKK